MYTTLNKIRECRPCVIKKDDDFGFRKLLNYLNKQTSDNDKLSLLTILNSNGLDDALWCLMAVDGYKKEKRLFAVFCAKKVKHLMKDERSLRAIEVAEKYSNEEATEEELEHAANEAGDVVRAYFAVRADFDARATVYVAAAVAAAAVADDVTDPAYWTAYTVNYHVESCRAEQQEELRRILKITCEE